MARSYVFVEQQPGGSDAGAAYAALGAFAFDAPVTAGMTLQLISASGAAAFQVETVVHAASGSGRHDLAVVRRLPQFPADVLEMTAHG